MSAGAGRWVVRHVREVVRTRGKGTYDLSAAAARAVAEAGLGEGSLTVFVRHTSCSLVIMENADVTAREDLHEFFERLVPEDTAWFRHCWEGKDDMPSHIRMALTRTSEVIPVSGGCLLWGTWQGLYLFEHRREEQEREVIFTAMGLG